MECTKPLRQYRKRRRVALLFQRFHRFRSYQRAPIRGGDIQKGARLQGTERIAGRNFSPRP